MATTLDATRPTVSPTKLMAGVAVHAIRTGHQRVRVHHLPEPLGLLLRAISKGTPRHPEVD
jgi:hypothetical protein